MARDKSQCFNDLMPRLDLTVIEQCAQNYWLSQNTPQRVIENAWNRSSTLFAFLEGPPTTNGRMHVGHARGRTYKDIVIKYHILRGDKVWALGGWDTQGLPVELEVEKTLGIKSKKDIEKKIGIDKFVEECKKSVDHYISLWIKDNLRWAIWMDYLNAYETRHPRYIETIWKFIKEVHNKGLLEEGFKVVPRCPRCDTALSGHEVSLGTKKVPWPYLHFLVMIKDPEIIGLDKKKVMFVVWTTTPWTIPANVALAVNRELDYIILRCICDEEINIITSVNSEKDVLNYLKKNYGCIKCEEFRKVKGKELVGLRYTPPQEGLVEIPEWVYNSGFTVVDASWVTPEEGTGIVHIAPMHGPEDFELAKEKNLPIWTPLSKEGYFENGKLKDMWFVNSTTAIVDFLKKKTLLLNYELRVHEYPHCWRCETPLLFYASKQWFIKTSIIKEDLGKLLDEVKFYPHWGKIRMLNWIKNIRDWCISRERYWGTPLPVWKHDSEVLIIDNIKYVEKFAKTNIKDPHRPYIDVELEVNNKRYEREKFVLDVWMDSGMAHTAALYQLGKPDLLNKLFPYDLVIEPPEQIRGWFYTLLVTSYVLYGKPPYRRILMYGLVLDEKGRKMSKSKGNVVWAYEAAEKYNVDVLRLFFTLHAPWEDAKFKLDEIRRIRNVLNTVYSMFTFFNLYASLDKWTIKDSTFNIRYPLNAWLIDSWMQLELNIAKYIEEMRFHDAFRSLLDYLIDNVSHQYIVVIRSLLWNPGMDEFKREIYTTLWTVLMRSLSYLSIVTPHLGEYLYQVLKSKFDSENSKESIFFETFDTIVQLPTINVRRQDIDVIEEAFKVAKVIVSTKTKLGLKRRYPLREVIIESKSNLGKTLIHDIALIVKNYSIIKNIKFVSRLDEKEVKNYTKVYSSDRFVVYVPTTITEEEIQEGLAREIIRRINVFRRNLGLNIEQYIDSIVIVFHTESKPIMDAIRKFEELIKNETRVKELLITHGQKSCWEACNDFKVDNAKISICLGNKIIHK